VSDVAYYADELGGAGGNDDMALVPLHVDVNRFDDSRAVDSYESVGGGVHLRPPPNLRITTESNMADLIRVPRLDAKIKPSPCHIAESEFPSLVEAAGIRQRKHSPMPGVKQHRNSKGRKVSTGESDEQISPTFSDCAVSVTDYGTSPDQLYANANCCANWSQLRAKDNNTVSSSDPLCHRQSSVDSKTIALPVNVCTDKKLLSMSMVLADFLKEDQCSKSGNVESSTEQSGSGEGDFVPMLICTLCHDRTHTIRSCPQSMVDFFYDSECGN